MIFFFITCFFTILCLTDNLFGFEDLTPLLRSEKYVTLIPPLKPGEQRQLNYDRAKIDRLLDTRFVDVIRLIYPPNIKGWKAIMKEKIKTEINKGTFHPVFLGIIPCDEGKKEDITVQEYLKRVPAEKLKSEKDRLAIVIAYNGMVIEKLMYDTCHDYPNFFPCPGRERHAQRLDRFVIKKKIINEKIRELLDRL